MSKWDVFISHASEDKKKFVKPLADFLSGLGADIWYDELTLEVGDSLSRSIDKGLASSRFGVVVLSPAFFAKDWPEYELRGLVAKELGREKVILPIWHEVTKEDVLSYSPTLADKMAFSSDKLSVEEIGLRILGVVRPDILEYVHARVAYEKARKTAKRKEIAVKELKPAPVRHEELPESLVGRIRLVRAALLFPYPQTMEFWLDGFKRDTNPHDEVSYWERVASCFLEYVAVTRLDARQQKSAFVLIMDYLHGRTGEDVSQRESELPEESLDLLKATCASKSPAYELSGLPSTLDEVMNMSEDELSELRKMYSPKES
jgi:hypothetical protein